MSDRQEDANSGSPLLEPSEGESQRLFGKLSEIQELVVREQASLRETLAGTEEPNVYFFYDPVSGDKIFQAQERFDGCCVACQAQCCGGKRSFTVTIYDNFKRPIIQIERPNACLWAGCLPSLGCFNCCDHATISIRNYKTIGFPWEVLGSVKQTWNPIFPTFRTTMNNSAPGKGSYKIDGPLILCGGNVQFHIRDSKSGARDGEIVKEWMGICYEATTDADRYRIKFPSDLRDEKVKVLLIGVMIFLDYKYFDA